MTLFKSRRRDRLRRQPFLAEWRGIVERNVSTFGRLPANDQPELLGHAQVLLSEKHFEGCGGLELTDEIRVTIAAHASVLLLHRETDYFPRLTSILIYPSAYVVTGERQIGERVWEDGDDVRLGHTGARLGALVIAWDDVPRGELAPADGQNVVLHEFAHQLDFEDFVVDGAPLLEARQSASWARVLNAEYDALRKAVDAREDTLIRPYGATDPAEFFAVITELFFERPRELGKEHPALYQELRTFFRQDPGSWGEAGSSPSGIPPKL